MDKKTLFVIFGMMIGIGLLSYFAKGSTTGEMAGSSLFLKNSQVPQQKSKVKLYFVKLNDNGKSGMRIGCGDSLVSSDFEMGSSTPSAKETLGGLLGIRASEYGQEKLYNSLSQSQLSVSGVDTSNKIANVTLVGKLLLGGTCDAPRVKAQLEETIRTATGLKTVKIMVNNRDLDSVLSGK